MKAGTVKLAKAVGGRGAEGYFVSMPLDSPSSSEYKMSFASS